MADCLPADYRSSACSGRKFCGVITGSSISGRTRFTSGANSVGTFLRNVRGRLGETSQPLISQAFVLGPGLGTRLRPLTEELPKPLVPIFQKPLITFAFDHLLGSGVESFAINTH